MLRMACERCGRSRRQLARFPTLRESDQRKAMREPADPHSPEQVLQEHAAGGVSDVLLNLKHALSRARRAYKIVIKDGVDRNAELALAGALAGIDKLRKRLMQGTYFAGDAVRRYLTGDDIAQVPDQGPRRWIIDFGLRSLDEAQHSAAALGVVRDRVRPKREENRRDL